jgi:hypothetical protein
LLARNPQNYLPKFTIADITHTEGVDQVTAGVFSTSGSAYWKATSDNLKAILS